MLKVVITYADLGNSDYVPLIDMAFASARKFGYKTVLVTDAGATKETLMPWILAAQKKFIDSDDFDGNSVLFSPDCLINRPLEPVCDFDFDPLNRHAGQKRNLFLVILNAMRLFC